MSPRILIPIIAKVNDHNVQTVSRAKSKTAESGFSVNGVGDAVKVNRPKVKSSIGKTRITVKTIGMSE